MVPSDQLKELKNKFINCSSNWHHYSTKYNDHGQNEIDLFSAKVTIVPMKGHFEIILILSWILESLVIDMEPSFIKSF